MIPLDAEVERQLLDVGALLDTARRRNRLTVQAWAQRSGVSKNSALRVVNARANPNLRTLTALAAGAGVTLRIETLPDRSEPRG